MRRMLMIKATNETNDSGVRPHSEHNIPQQASLRAVGGADRADREPWHLYCVITGLMAFVVWGVAGAQRLPAQPPKVTTGDRSNDFREIPRQEGESRSYAPPANAAVSQRLSDVRPITPTGRNLSSASSASRKSSPGSGSPWKTLGALAFVLALIIVGAKLWKKHGLGIAAGLPAEAIDVLGKRHLDSRQSIHLIRLGSRIIVLGSSTDGLRTLAEVTDPVEVDYLAGLCRQENSGGSAAQSFRTLFSRHSSAKQKHEAQETRFFGKTGFLPKQKHEAEVLFDRTPENEFSIGGPTHDDSIAHSGLASEEARV